MRGPGGGYVLSRSMDEITICNVLDSVGDNINPAKDIIGSESETVNTTEYMLSRGYFENLALIMKEYLQTTSLGDLMRKANEINHEANQTERTRFESSLESPFESVIRSSIGEINQ